MILLVVLVVLAVGVWVEGRSRLRKHGWHRLIWRWHTGASWHGQAVAGDEWTFPGPWYHRLTRPKRALVKWAVDVAVVGTLWGLLYHRHATSRFAVAAGIVIASAALLALGWVVFSFPHRRRWVRPVHQRIAPMIDVPFAGPMRHITIKRDRSEARVKLPQKWTTDDKGRAELARTVAETIGLESPEASWRLAGPAPLLTLTTSKPPPDRVILADVMPYIARARNDELIWGLGKRKAVIDTSLSGDSPHIGLSMASGAGKSVTARAMLAQMLWHGAIGLILDVKMISHQWARDLPNVAIVRRPHEIHAALLWLGREADRRNEVALTGSDLDGNVHAVVGPRLIIICEELNATVAKLRTYWRQVRDDDRSLPQRSPALDALDSVSFMGRQVLMNLIYIGQRLSVKGVGGDGDARENIGVIAFGRYSQSNWKMLAPDYVMPPSSRKPGRIQVVSDRVQECQALFLPAIAARELATTGTVTPLPAGVPGRVAVPVGQVAIPQPEQPFDLGSRTQPGLVTLRQFHDSRRWHRSLGALQRASTRPGFPPKRGQVAMAALYDELDLAAFAAGEYEAR